MQENVTNIYFSIFSENNWFGAQPTSAYLCYGFKYKTSAMQVPDLLERALRLESLTAEEGVFLLEQAATAELAYVANALRQIRVN